MTTALPCKFSRAIRRMAHPTLARPARIAAALIGPALLAGMPAHAAGDAAKGGALFATHCAECHSVKEGKDKKGPSLYAIFGRKAAQRAEFVYSDAMRASGTVWTADALSAYLADPRKAVRGGKMKYDGMPSEADRADLIAYLASLPK